MKTFSGREPSQDQTELRWLMGVLEDYHVRRYLEIGAREGDTFHAIMDHLWWALPQHTIAGPPMFGLAVDLPDGPWGKVGTTGQLNAAVAELNRYNYMAADLVLGDSTGIGVIHEVKRYAPFGAVFIDGDHSARGVWSDFLIYRDMARIVAFHDIAGAVRHETWGDVEVPAVWKEKILPWAEEWGHTVMTCATNKTGGFGIGLVIQDGTGRP